MPKKPTKHYTASTRRRMATFMRSGVQSMFLRHARLLAIAIIMMGAVASISLAAWILFVTPAAPDGTSAREIRLKTDTIDELELFIEVRQTAYENPPSIAPRIFGL